MFLEENSIKILYNNAKGDIQNIRCVDSNKTLSYVELGGRFQRNKSQY